MDTVEGAIQHRRVDEKTTALPAPADLPESIHSRAVTLSSERLRVIAKMDLVEVEGGVVTPVDYKHGSPREGPDGLELWPARPRATGGAGNRAAGERVPAARKASPTTARRGSACAWRSTKALIAETDRLILRGVGAGGSGRDSAAAGGFAEVSGLLAGGHLPAGRDVACGRAEAEEEPQQLGAVRTPRREAGEARGAGADDAAQRAAARCI